MGIVLYIIILVVVALIALPIILSHSRKIKRDKELKARLAASAPAAGLTLSQSDAWNGTYAIGIDTDKRKLVYFSKASGTLREESVDLSIARDCRVDAVARTEKTPNGSLTIVDAISLVIIFRDKALDEKRLEFFNSEVFPTVGSERAMAEKWQKIVESVFKID